jgi:hypothetical protein
VAIARVTVTGPVVWVASWRHAANAKATEPRSSGMRRMHRILAWAGMSQVETVLLTSVVDGWVLTS